MALPGVRAEARKRALSERAIDPAFRLATGKDISPLTADEYGKAGRIEAGIEATAGQTLSSDTALRVAESRAEQAAARIRFQLQGVDIKQAAEARHIADAISDLEADYEAGNRTPESAARNLAALRQLQRRADALRTGEPGQDRAAPVDERRFIPGDRGEEEKGRFVTAGRAVTRAEERDFIPEAAGVTAQEGSLVAAREKAEADKEANGRLSPVALSKLEAEGARTERTREQTETERERRNLIVIRQTQLRELIKMIPEEFDLKVRRLEGTEEFRRAILGLDTGGTFLRFLSTEFPRPDNVDPEVWLSVITSLAEAYQGRFGPLPQRGEPSKAGELLPKPTAEFDSRPKGAKPPFAGQMPRGKGPTLRDVSGPKKPSKKLSPEQKLALARENIVRLENAKARGQKLTPAQEQELTRDTAYVMGTAKVKGKEAAIAKPEDPTAKAFRQAMKAVGLGHLLKEKGAK